MVYYQMNDICILFYQFICFGKNIHEKVIYIECLYCYNVNIIVILAVILSIIYCYITVYLNRNSNY